AGRVAGYYSGFTYDLLDESAHVLSQGIRRVLFRRSVRFSMPVFIDGKDVEVPCQCGQDSIVTLPTRHLPVNEQKCRPIVGSFRVVYGRTVDLNLLFDKSRTTNLPSVPTVIVH